MNFLEHIKNDKELINEIYKVLPYNGQLISILPSSKFLYGKLDMAYKNYRRYDHHEIHKRFYPFLLSYHRKSGMMRYLGWLSYKNRKYQGLKKPWNLYHSYFFLIDRFLDLSLGKFLPFGASLVLVHTKYKAAL